MILLAGDWVPGDKRVVLGLSDHKVIANLEGPLLSIGHGFTTSPKAGPHLTSSSLPDGNIPFLFSLANNHTMDYGHPGLEATWEHLLQPGFKGIGAGKDLCAARQPIVIRDNGACLGIIACCEPQFGVAGPNTPGVAAFGPWIYRAIRDLSTKTDAVFVSVHAGIEDSPWPSPYIRELYQSFIEAGASVVHGHHPHLPQGYEAYGTGVIFYGMGNFAVDPAGWTATPNSMWSLAAEIDVGSASLSWRPLTLEIRRKPGSDTIAIEKSNEEEWKQHTEYLAKCNVPFGDPELFEGLWQEVALRSYHHHGARYMGFPSAQWRIKIRGALSALKAALMNRNLSRYEYLLRYHMIACESHRQMLTTALGVLSGEQKDVRSEATQRLADEMMPWSLAIS